MWLQWLIVLPFSKYIDLPWPVYCWCFSNRKFAPPVERKIGAHAKEKHCSQASNHWSMSTWQRSCFPNSTFPPGQHLLNTTVQHLSRCSPRNALFWAWRWSGMAVKLSWMQCNGIIDRSKSDGRTFFISDRKFCCADRRQHLIFWGRMEMGLSTIDGWGKWWLVPGVLVQKWVD